MRTTKFVAALALLFLLIAMAWALPPQAAHAQCGLPGYGDCDPGDGGKKKEEEREKRPTPTDLPTATATRGFVPMSGGGDGSLAPLATSTATIDPSVYATARACWDSIYRQTPAPELPTPSWGDIQYDAPQCIPTPAPTKVPPISVTHVAGPIFVAPGVKNALIAVLIIGVSLIGLIIARRFMTPGPPTKPNKPPNPNK